MYICQNYSYITEVFFAFTWLMDYTEIRLNHKKRNNKNISFTFIQMVFVEVSTNTNPCLSPFYRIQMKLLGSLGSLIQHSFIHSFLIHHVVTWYENHNTKKIPYACVCFPQSIEKHLVNGKSYKWKLFVVSVMSKRLEEISWGSRNIFMYIIH